MGKRTPYSQRQIAAILRQHAQGTSISALCARYGISRATLYRWRMQRSAATDKKQSLARENRTLRSKVDALSADKILLQYLLRRAR